MSLAHDMRDALDVLIGREDAVAGAERDLHETRVSRALRSRAKDDQIRALVLRIAVLEGALDNAAESAYEIDAFTVAMEASAWRLLIEVRKKT